MKPKTRFHPPKNRNKELEALRSLMNNNGKFIKNADKGGAIVIFLKDHYRDAVTFKPY